ncbi:SRPBCC domain-containing protein [Candidatus Poribacteria bacterium]|nr:SRPBCC domain-containing protein [Candidatus Poribacteria bacterium]
MRDCTAPNIMQTLLAACCLLSLAAIMAEPSTEETMPMSKRTLFKEATVSATPEAAWALWTTQEGTPNFFGQGSRIEPREGGAYEIYFNLAAPEGLRGSEGCKIVKLDAPRELAFTWNAPPSLAALRESGARTTVTVRFEEQPGGMVHLTLTQSAFGDGEEWEEYYAYFDKAWASVLAGFEAHFAATAGAGQPEPVQRQWVYFVRPVRDEFFTAATEFEEETVSAHAQYVRGLLDRGSLILAGPCWDPSHGAEGDKAVAFEMQSPGIVAFEADGLEAAKAVMNSDPAVREGVFKARLAPFHMAFARKELNGPESAE